MKKGLLVYETNSRFCNIGDYIQSAAAKQYFDKIDVFVEREDLDNFDSDDDVKVIMNGWYMHHPNHWPPSEKIIPLFTSMHISSHAAPKMLTPKGIEYLKRHEPIGCRDVDTMKILTKENISCYFSGCLTLTLGNTYSCQVKENKLILFVDPYYDVILRHKEDLFNIKGIILGLSKLIKNRKMIMMIDKKKNFVDECCMKLDSSPKFFQYIYRLWCISMFYNTYKSLFSDELILNAQYITHEVSSDLIKNNEQGIEYAEHLLELYSRAQLVITSRIHCALPCVGIETPVLFVTSEELESSDSVRNTGRFSGLLDLFHVVRCKKNKLFLVDRILASRIGNDKISSSFQMVNKSNYLLLKEQLVKQCVEFMR